MLILGGSGKQSDLNTQEGTCFFLILKISWFLLLLHRFFLSWLKEQFLIQVSSEVSFFISFENGLFKSLCPIFSLALIPSKEEV